MFENYDPYLTRFLNDIGLCISLVFQAVELLFGISYFAGRKVVEGVVWLFQASRIGYSEASSFATIVRDEIVEFGSSFMRAVLLIYYAGFMIVEAFYITVMDSYSLTCHVFNSISNNIQEASKFLVNCTLGIFTDVPQQIVDALSMIGESVLNFYLCLIDIIKDFLVQAIISPFNAAWTIGKFLTSLVIIPAKSVYSMPPSSKVGLLVVLIGIFLFRRLLRYFVLRNFRVVFITIVSILSKILAVTRLKHFITSTVWTVARLQEQGGSSENCKAACVICQDKPVSYMTNPCRHVCLCEVCVHNLLQHDSKCPICRTNVTKYDRVFVA